VSRRKRRKEIHWKKNDQLISHESEEKESLYDEMDLGSN
jgi:hypothetical protein